MSLLPVSPTKKSIPLFLDLDDTCADFSKGVFERLGFYPPSKSDDDYKIRSKRMWSRISPPSENDFFSSLDPMPDFQELWSYCSPFHPIILTGKPMGNWADEQKINWVKKHMGENVPIIVCPRVLKAEYAKKYCEEHGFDTLGVLVDDYPAARELWESAGGVFVLHTSAKSSIEELRNLGFIHQ